MFEFCRLLKYCVIVSNLLFVCFLVFVGLVIVWACDCLGICFSWGGFDGFSKFCFLDLIALQIGSLFVVCAFQV